MINYPARRQRVQTLMASQGIDLLAVGPSENMAYLLGFHSHPDERPCLFFLTPTQEGFLMPALNAEDARQHYHQAMHEWADEDGPDEALNQLAEEIEFSSINTIALDETMRTDFSLLLLARLPQAEAKLASEVLAPLRMRKDASELSLLRANANIADQAMQAAFAAVAEGVTENEVANAAREAFAAGKVDQVSFTIVGAGKHGAYPHHHTGNTALRASDAIVIDIGARKDQYNSDITRMAFLGEPSQKYLEVHQIVEEAVQAALAIIKPGVTAKDIDKAARDVISQAGYGDYFVHRTGHGLGLTGHEPPYITASNDVALDEGMVFSVEPGIYLPGKFGVRLEEIVTVTTTGVQVFSKLTRDVHITGL